ncbi:MAG: efflux RND transporter permease subunit, partial [Geminicoccaceae bacterium]
VRAVSSELPVWASAPFMIQPLSSTSRVVKVGFSTEKKDTQTLIDTALTAYWTVRPRLMRVPGVANVAIWGDRWNVLQVQADPTRMQERKASLIDIMEASADALDVGMLKFSSGHEIGTGGFIDTPNQRLGIRHILPNLTPEELAQMPLSVPEGIQKTVLGDVADVVRGRQPHMNGDAVINEDVGLMMIVEKLSWGNTLEVTKGIEAALEELRPGLPGIEIDTTIFRPATFIEEALVNLSGAMLVGFVLISVVLIIFLFEWRVAIISILSIPLSVVAAGLVLKYTGQSINTMVLAGLVIALGVIVDDAIIDVENIVRRLRQHRREGGTKSAFKIVLDASIEVRAPIIHATLIILATTVPIFLLQGLAGSFFRPLGFAYAMAILASMIVAMTVTPALALMLLVNAPLEKRISPLAVWLQKHYEAILSKIIDNPRNAYMTVAGVFALGFLVVPFLGQSLFPSFKERDFLMHWVAKPGTSHEEMMRISKAGGVDLLQIPGVRNFGAHIGQGTLADEPVGMNFGENWISIEKSVDYDKTRAAVQKIVDEYPGLYRDVQTYLKERTKEVLTGTGHGIVIRVSGNDLGILREKANEIKDLVADIDDVRDAHVDLVLDIPQLEIEVDLEAASRYGIKPGDVRRAASTYIASEEAGDIWRGGKNYEVHVWSTPEHRNSINSATNLLMDSPNNGTSVRLGDLATVEMRPTPNIILREDNSRRIDVSAEVPDSELGRAAREILARLETVDMPLGYHAELLGEFRERQAASARLQITSIGALFAILLILQTAFGSWRLATLVLLTLPFALVGGFLATSISDAVMSLGTLVGLLTVLGIAARNGILMINHCQHLERYEGETFGKQLVLRGAKERLSPILMTSLATGAGVLPLVIAGSVPGNEIEHPMAVVIPGGLVTSTVLNLFVVPSLYLRFDRSKPVEGDTPPASGGGGFPWSWFGTRST